MGGGFGTKGSLYPEELLVSYAAARLGVPVKWIEDRTEHFAATTPRARADRPEAVFAMERAMDLLARALRLDPVEVRRRNLIRPKSMPYATGLVYRDGTDQVYDSGDYPALLDKAVELSDEAGWWWRSALPRSPLSSVGSGVVSL